MYIEIPFAGKQIFHLVSSESRCAIDRAHNRMSLDRNLRLRILTRHGRTVKVCCYGRTSQILKRYVIGELIRFRIYRGRQHSMTLAGVRRYLG